MIVQEIERGVRIFDKTKPTCIATDWSKEGIGFWLFQKHCRCLDKARHFVLGCENLIVAVDHKPLLKLLADRALDDIPNPRLRNLKEKTLRYRFRITHIPGMKNKTADAMSRRPVGTALPSLMNLPDDNAAIGIHLPSSMHTNVLSLLRRIEQDDDDDDDDDVEEDNLTWCAAGQGGYQQRRRYAHTGGNGNRRHPRLEDRDARDDSRLSPVPRKHHIDRRSDPIQGQGYHTALTPR